MNFKQSQILLIGTALLILPSACSRNSEPDRSYSSQSSQTAQLPEFAVAAEASPSSGDLVCPVADGVTLAETAVQIDAIGQQLASGGGNEMAAAAAQLRTRHPNASEGEIVNYLITAYCPTIRAKPEMSLREKQNAVRDFATRARMVVGPA